MPVSGSEHFTLTRLDPGVRDVGVYIGWAGRWTRAAHAAGGVLSLGTRVPLLGGAIRAGVGKAAGWRDGRGSVGGEEGRGQVRRRRAHRSTASAASSATSASRARARTT